TRASSIGTATACSATPPCRRGITTRSPSPWRSPPRAWSAPRARTPPVRARAGPDSRRGWRSTAPAPSVDELERCPNGRDRARSASVAASVGGVGDPGALLPAPDVEARDERSPDLLHRRAGVREVSSAYEGVARVLEVAIEHLRSQILTLAI